MKCKPFCIFQKKRNYLLPFFIFRFIILADPKMLPFFWGGVHRTLTVSPCEHCTHHIAVTPNARSTMSPLRLQVAQLFGARWHANRTLSTDADVTVPRVCQSFYIHSYWEYSLVEQFYALPANDLQNIDLFPDDSCPVCILLFIRMAKNANVKVGINGNF